MYTLWQLREAYLWLCVCFQYDAEWSWNFWPTERILHDILYQVPKMVK